MAQQVGVREAGDEEELVSLSMEQALRELDTVISHAFGMQVIPSCCQSCCNKALWSFWHNLTPIVSQNCVTVLDHLCTLPALVASHLSTPIRTRGSFGMSARVAWIAGERG